METCMRVCPAKHSQWGRCFGFLTSHARGVCPGLFVVLRNFPAYCLVDLFAWPDVSLCQNASYLFSEKCLWVVLNSLKSWCGHLRLVPRIHTVTTTVKSLISYQGTRLFFSFQPRFGLCWVEWKQDGHTRILIMIVICIYIQLFSLILKASFNMFWLADSQSQRGYHCTITVSATMLVHVYYKTKTRSNITELECGSQISVCSRPLSCCHHLGHVPCNSNEC